MRRQLLFLMIDELGRFAWDAFLFERQREIEIKKQRSMDENELLFILLDDCLKCLKLNAKETSDESKTRAFYFILMGRKFRQFWHAMKRGDGALQERIANG